MLGPIDQHIATSYPKFSALYNYLVTNQLNEDGSTRLHDPKAIKERDAFNEEFLKLRRDHINRTLIHDGFRALSRSGELLSEELREVAMIVSAVMAGEVSEENMDLVQEHLEKLELKIRPIADALARHVQDHANAIVSIFNSSANGPTSISELPEMLSRLQQERDATRAELAQTRTSIAQTVYQLHLLNRQVLEIAVRLLEQTIHGSESRSAKAEADYIATVAEGISKKLNVQLAQRKQQLYSPELKDRLQLLAEESKREMVSVFKEAEAAEAELAKYRAIRGMESLIEEYSAILQETEKIQGEIDRIQAQTT